MSAKVRVEVEVDVSGDVLYPFGKHGFVTFEFGPFVDQPVLVQQLTQQERRVLALSGFTAKELIKGVDWRPSQFKGDLAMLVTMTDIQQTAVKIKKILDKRGHEVEVVDTQPIEWFCDNTDILNIAPSADGKSCVVSAMGPVTQGDSVVVVSCRIQTVGGEILGTAEFKITHSAPNSVELEVDPPTDQTIQKRMTMRGK